MKQIPIEMAAYLCILWFVTGMQVGHVEAKYARAKKESLIIMAFLVLLSLLFTVDAFLF